MANADSLTGIANRHDFTKSFTNEYDMNKTALTIITPTTGTSIVVKGVYINTEGNSGFIRLTIGGDTIFTIFASATPASGYVPVYIKGAVNTPVRVTSTVGDGSNYCVLVNYKEV